MEIHNVQGVGGCDGFQRDAHRGSNAITSPSTHGSGSGISGFSMTSIGANLRYSVTVNCCSECSHATKYCPSHHVRLKKQRKKK